MWPWNGIRFAYAWQSTGIHTITGIIAKAQSGDSAIVASLPGADLSVEACFPFAFNNDIQSGAIAKYVVGQRSEMLAAADQ